MDRRKSLIFVLLLAFISSASALSCLMPPDKLVFHCPGENTCENNLKINQAPDLDYEDISEISPNTSETNSTTNTSAAKRYTVRKWSNSSLPSTDKAILKDKSICPGQRNIHFYPKENFSKKELKEREKCYKTDVEETESYYKVTREGTTEPWHCIRKREESMFTRRERSWIGPMKWDDIVTRALELSSRNNILLNDILLLLPR